MKTIFDEAVKEELINRINLLHDGSISKWGNMNVYQMVIHCTRWEEMLNGSLKVRRVFIGILLGKILLRKEVKSDSPIKRGSPTVPELLVNEADGDLMMEKNKWIYLIEQNTKHINSDFVHPFFGKMTNEQLGVIHYKHIDHHLRQFGV